MPNRSKIPEVSNVQTPQELTATTQITISARLDRLPASPYLTGLIARIAVGGWFEFFDLFMAANISLGLFKAGIFTATTANFFAWKGFASFIASGFAGMFLGTLLLSGMSDRYGRKKTFTFSLITYSVATIIMAFQNSPLAIDIWRFVAGLGIGLQLVTIDTYISEISPRETRGRNISFSHFISYSSVPFAALVALILVPRTILGLDGWRWVAMIGGLGAPIFAAVRSGLPESPRWYESRGRKREAEAAICTMESGVQKSLGRELPPPRPLTEHIHQHRNLTDIFRRPYISRTTMLVIANIFQTVGFYGFASWVPVFLMQQGVSFVNSLAYTFLIASMNVVGPLIAMKYSDVFQRKWQLVTLSLASAGLGILFSEVRSPGLLILLGALITIANTWFSCALHIYQSELYPTGIRSKAVGFVFSWSRLSAIFVGFLIAALLKSLGVLGVFAVMAGSMCAVAVAVGAMGPKTSGVSLETTSS
jgi:MFS transporter, putative metabolite:H+ symporter